MGDEQSTAVLAFCARRISRETLPFHRVIRSRRSRMHGSSAPRLTFIRRFHLPAARLHNFKSVKLKIQTNIHTKTRTCQENKTINY